MPNWHERQFSYQSLGKPRDKSGKIPSYHYDFYRLEQGAQLEALNLEDYLYGKGVCLIEWPELALPSLDYAQDKRAPGLPIKVGGAGWFWVRLPAPVSCEKAYFNTPHIFLANET